MASTCILEAGDHYKTVCGEILQTAKGRLIFHCMICSKIYDDSVEYLLHISLEHKIEDERYGTVMSLEEEVEPEAFDIERDIQEDNSLDDNFDQVEDSVMENELIESFECDVCYQILDSEDSYLAHVRQHNEENDVRPSFDLKQLDTTQSSKTPDVSTKENIRNENNTPKSNNTKEKQIKNPPKRKYKCKICGITMTQSSNMMGHIRRHSEKNKKHKCSHCPKSFFSRTEVVFHERTHTGERPYLCAECGSRFRSASQLTYHSRLHKTREKTVKCEFCDKTFYDKYRLRGHMVVHKDDRDHVCTECNAAFKHSKALAQHKKIHLNKREYECSICGARFNQRPGLRSHLKTLHHL